MNEALAKAAKIAGGHRALSRKLGLNHNATLDWKGRVPAERVHAVEKITGIPRSELRPDIYPPSREAKRA